MMEVFGNYTRAIRAALGGDPSVLADALRRGAPLTAADRSMLADYLTGNLRLLHRRRARGRPRSRTLQGLLRSKAWQDRATVEFYVRCERAKRDGRRRAPASEIRAALALEEGVDPALLAAAVKERLPAIRRAVKEQAAAERLLAQVRALRAQNRTQEG